MGIEEDIKQKRPFDSEVEKALVNIMFTNGWVNENLKKQYKPFGITPKQYNILRILGGAEKPLTTSVIRSRMIDKMSDITRLIDRLILKDVVSKKIKIEDRRLVDISITQKGIKLLQTIKTSASQEFAGELSVDEAAILNNLLDKLRGSP